MKKKVLSFLIAAGFAMSALSGCGGSSAPPAQAASSSTTPSQTQTDGGTAVPTAPLEEVTLKVYTSGDPKSAQQEVLDALFELTKEQINAKLEINFIPFGDYEDKMTALVSAGDNFDACYVADWLLYPKMVNKNAFLPLNSLMEQYAPTLYKDYQDKDMVKPCSVNGEMVALPWTTEKSSKAVFLWRKDLAEKYGVDTSNLTAIEDMDRVLTEAKQKIPEMTTFLPSFTDAKDQSAALCALHAKYGMDRMDFHMLTLDLSSEKPKIIPIEQTEMFREAVKYGQKWQNAGIIAKNDMSNTDSMRFSNGKAFSMMNIMDNTLSWVFNDPEAELGYAELYPDGKYRKDSPMNNALALNKHAANPERMLMLLELLNTDQAAYDMLMYGIEGKTYSMDGETVVFPEGQDATNSIYLNWYNWEFVRAKFDRPTQTRSKETLEQIQAFLGRPNLVTSPAVGFSPDTNEIKTEIAQRDQLYNETGKLLWNGIFEGDADAAVDKYIEQQKAVGLDKILTGIQTQFDGFLAQ